MLLQPDAAVGAEFEARMLMNVRAAIDAHGKECPRQAKSILLNPANHELLGWDEVLGLPVLPDEKVETMRARLVCGEGRAGYCEEGRVEWDEHGGAYIRSSTDDP